MSRQTTHSILDVTARIVAAHLTNNPVEAAALPSLIQSVYRTLSGVDGPGPAPATAALLPAVPVKKSIFPDFIVCLEDGQKLKMLKRHLQTSYGLTPDDYRKKWGCRGTIQWWRRTTPPRDPPWPSRSAWAANRPRRRPSRKRRSCQHGVPAARRGNGRRREVVAFTASRVERRSRQVLPASHHRTSSSSSQLVV